MRVLAVAVIGEDDEAAVVTVVAAAAAAAAVVASEADSAPRWHGRGSWRGKLEPQLE